jgi:DNA-binding GntR family transcriptional regulator
MASNQPPPRLGDSIRHTLELDIVSGRLQPGERVEERVVMARFGVSRTPVRQALRQLQQSGMLVPVPRRGMVVAVMSSTDYAAGLEVLIELECMAARLASRRLPPGRRQLFKSLLTEGWDLALAGNAAEYAASNRRFHDLIHACGLNPVLAAKIQHLRLDLRFPPSDLFGLRGHMGRSLADHERLAQAILEGDEVSAGRVMELHIRRAHHDLSTGQSLSGPLRERSEGA